MANEDDLTKLGREDEVENFYKQKLDTTQKARSSEDAPDTTARELSNRETSAGTIEETDGSTDDPKSKEEDGSWNTKVEAQAPKPKQKGFEGFMQANRKKGPIAAILAILVLVAFGISFITPGLLLIHITETITDRLNMQSASMKVRTNRIYAKKLSNQALSGVCTQKITVRCKFNSLNERQLKSLRAAGIEIEIDKNTTITGRYKPTKMSFEKNGVKTEINPTNLSIELQKNDELRQAMDKAYSSKLAGWADNKAKAVLDSLGLHKQPPTTGALTDEEREEKQRLDANTKEGSASASDEGRYRPVDEEKPDGEWTDGSKNADGTFNTVTKEVAEEANAKALSEAGTLEKGIAGIAENKTKVTGQVLTAAEEALESGEVASVSKAKAFAGGVLGFALTVPDQACNFYGMYKAVSYGAKTIRALQTAHYAMGFLSMGSKQKAGDSSPEELAFYADKLTKTVSQETLNDKGEKVYTASKPATDSYGYNYVAYGDTGPLTPSAAEFANGGGLGGKMNGIADAIIAKFGGKENIDDVCGAIKSPIVQGGVLLVGIAAIAFGGPIGAGAVGSLLLGAGAGIIAGTALSMAESLLTPILADMAAGILIDDTVFGEKSGDALVSGAGYIMSNMAGAGGNAPLTPQDAVAYNGVQSQILAQQAEDERMALSPFDPSSRYTFMGRIVDQLLPYQSQMTNASSFVNTSYSVVTRSLSTIFNPSAFAKEATVATYTQCDDVDYKELNLATDPFCNPIRGIPPQYLGTDPNTIVDSLIQSQDIDETSGEPKSEAYKNFIANCITREDPLGYTGDSFDAKKDGHDCFIKDDETASAATKAYWYLYQIDLRVIDGMENGFPDDAVCLPTTAAGGSSGPAAGMASAATIDALIEKEEGGTPGPMHGKGAKIIELSNQYGVNSNFITTIFREETHFGTDGSQGALHNNFGWNAENGDGDCPAISLSGRTYNCYSTPDKGIEGALKNITTVSAYRKVPKEAPPGTKEGTVAAVRNVYCPEGDGNCNLESFIKASSDIGLPLKKDDPVFTNPTDTTVVSGANTTSPSTTKISQSDLNTLISSSYYLPAPDQKAAEALKEKLASNPNAAWAAQQMLNGEKTWASKGGSVKPYLNTAWVWSEGGADAGPDPYEMNCNNQTESTTATATCGSNFQVAGYQAANRANDYVEVFKKLYPESQLSSVMKDVINNSSKASKEIWKYSDPSNNDRSSYYSNLDGITLSDIAPSKNFSDERTQVLTLILGKDPAMAAALNSFAVSDDDLVAALKKGGCLYGDCNYYNEAWKQNLSNMVLALYMFDGSGPSSSTTACKTSGSQPHGSGKGIAAIFNGTIPNITQEFGPTEFAKRPENFDMYKYQLEYGISRENFGHTGVDYGVELDTKIYSPVNGVVITAGGTPYFRSTDKLDGSGNSLPGTGELKIKLDNGDEVILGHLHKIDVKAGDKVTVGQYVGLSGTENGPHLHLEYRIPTNGDDETTSGMRIVDPRGHL